MLVVEWIAFICDQVQTTFPFITQPPSTYKKPSEGEINNCNVVTLAVAATVSPPQLWCTLAGVMMLGHIVQIHTAAGT